MSNPLYQLGMIARSVQKQMPITESIPTNIITLLCVKPITGLGNLHKYAMSNGLHDKQVWGEMLNRVDLSELERLKDGVSMIKQGDFWRGWYHFDALESKYLNITPEDVREIGKALYGRDWKSPLADALGISRLTVQRWDSGQLKPNIGHVADMLALVAANNDRLNNIIRDTVKPSRHTGKL